MLTCTKRIGDIPFAHRQHTHKGHCRFIHGHNWAFIFTFKCDVLDADGFVVDFGSLGWLKEWLNKTFDHKLVLGDKDPMSDWLQTALEGNLEQDDRPLLAEIQMVPNASCEGLAEWVHYCVNNALRTRTDPARGLHLVAITVEEDSKNSATYRE